MDLTLPDLRIGYQEVLRAIVDEGYRVVVRGQPTTELTGVTLRFPNPRHMLPIGIGRKLNTQLAAVESLGVLGGVWPHDLILKAAPQYLGVLVDPTENGALRTAYGPRLRHQLEDVIQLLLTDPTTRQAVLTIWRSSDLMTAGDRPCTLTLQFLLRRHRLECHAVMRSNDAWLGLAMDSFVFTQLQWMIVHMLGHGVQLGQYTHHVGSLHLYERDIEGAIRVMNTEPESIGPSARIWPAGVRSPGHARLLLAGDPTTTTHYPWYEKRLTQLREKTEATQ